MSNHNAHGNHGDHGGGDYEHEDFTPKSIFTFLVALGIFGLVVMFIVFASFRALDQYTISQMKMASPLMKADPATYTRKMEEKNILEFPAPRLDGGEKPADVTSRRRYEATVQSSYGWANQDAGEARMPIDAAMAMLAQRGLPARPEGSAGAPVAMKVVPTEKPVKAKALAVKP